MIGEKLKGMRITLPKVFWGDELHVAVSAEAIRWAIRYYWQMMDIAVNREWKEGHIQDIKWNNKADRER